MLLSHISVGQLNLGLILENPFNLFRICHTLRKPTLLKYDDSIWQHAQALARVGRVESDSLLHYYVELQRIAEEASHAFNYESRSVLSHADAICIDILARSFDQRITQLRRIIPPEIWNHGKGSMSLELSSADVYSSTITAAVLSY